MITIRRMVTKTKSYTVIMLPPNKPKVFPTTDQEHAKILGIYKQDKPYRDVLNDFTDFGIGTKT